MIIASQSYDMWEVPTSFGKKNRRKKKPTNEREHKRQELKETNEIRVFQIIVEKVAKLQRAPKKSAKNIYNE